MPVKTSNRQRVRPLARSERPASCVRTGNQGGTAEHAFVPVWTRAFLFLRPEPQTNILFFFGGAA